MVNNSEPENLPLILEDVLIFTTGAAGVPPLGFEEEPSIVFNAEDEAKSDLPTSSTCTNTLFIPTTNHNDCKKHRARSGSLQLVNYVCTCECTL